MKRFLSIVTSLIVAATAACGTPADPEQAQSSAEATRAPKRYSVADFYKNVSYRGASWSRDKQRLLASSNQSGIWNAYELPAAGGEPKPLTQSTTDSIFAISYFPDDERILYSERSRRQRDQPRLRQESRWFHPRSHAR